MRSQRDAIRRIAELAKNPPPNNLSVVGPVFREFRFGPWWRLKLSATSGPESLCWYVESPGKYGKYKITKGSSLAKVLHSAGWFPTCCDACAWTLSDDRSEKWPPPDFDPAACVVCRTPLA